MMKSVFGVNDQKKSLINFIEMMCILNSAS